jgi:RimJ/RimL family protein N-acetyltransferase
MIATERLVLARPVLADFADSYAMHGDAAVMAHISGRASTREEAWTKLLRNIGHWDVFGYGIFTVRERSGAGFVGEVGLAHFARDLGAAFDPYPEGAWVVASHGQGRGFATEALLAAHDWMTATHRPARTVCTIHPDNAASLRVAAKLGYVRFGEAQYRGAASIMFERLRG